jgi:hypothetical protein
MPHFGHRTAGSVDVTSGCIGQTYVTACVVAGCVVAVGAAPWPWPWSCPAAAAGAGAGGGAGA